jgi:general secretion pathway protein K
MTTRERENERGAALLIVMVAVAVLTALATDLAYDTRVSLRIAGNARDELQAAYLAKSGVALSRLVLSFQQSVDGAMPALPGQGMAMPRPQIWKIVPVDSTLAANLFPESGATPSVPPPPSGQERALAAAAALPPSGGFTADIDDEGTKVNVQLDSSYTGGLLGAQVVSLWQLICDPRWDALFDVEDENGQRYSRTDLLVNLKDWVDPDPVGSALAASFPGGGCSIVIPPGANPFEQGFSDENFPYDRGEDRYRAKNARMDSLAELYLVAGVTDTFIAAFGDALTVYLSRADKLNLNATDRLALLYKARLVADPPTQPVLYDPEFPDKLQKIVMERTLGGMLSLSPLDFGQLVQGLGVKVNLNVLTAQSTSNPFTDRSTVFKIKVAGRAGDVTKNLEAVVRFDAGQQGQQPPQVPQVPQALRPPAQPGRPAQPQGAAPVQQGQPPTATPGQLRHWRED